MSISFVFYLTHMEIRISLLGLVFPYVFLEIVREHVCFCKYRQGNVKHTGKFRFQVVNAIAYVFDMFKINESCQSLDKRWK
jgi:hypothetical protein